MRFDIHKKFRFDFNYSERKYLLALKEYIEHLTDIDFQKSPDLIKFFGLSFFHDGFIKSIDMDAFDPNLIITIYRDSDKEDLNFFRKNNSLPAIDDDDFYKNPVLYRCTFYGVSKFFVNINKESRFHIIDSEINFDNEFNKYLLEMSFNDSDNMSIACDKVQVKIANKETISYYTNKLTPDIPYCEHCKKTLLTLENVPDKLSELRAMI